MVSLVSPFVSFRFFFWGIVVCCILPLRKIIIVFGDPGSERNHRNVSFLLFCGVTVYVRQDSFFSLFVGQPSHSESPCIKTRWGW